IGFSGRIVMLRGIYSAASGLQLATENQEVISYNLANSTVPGYRQRGLVFESFDRELGRAITETGDSVGARVASSYTDFRAGPIHHPDNPSDLALSEPDQFFTLAGANGTVYSRAGNFRISPQGDLLSQSGYPVIGDNGPINVPADAQRVSIAKD